MFQLIRKKDLSEAERFFYDLASNKSASTIERVRVSILLAEAEAAKEGYIFTWRYEIQRGWFVEIYREPLDAGKPEYIETQEPNLDRKIDLDDAKRIVEAQIIVSFMSSEVR